MVEWKFIDGSNIYEACTDGNIRNHKTGRILKKSLDAKGNERVTLYIDGKAYPRKVSRIIGETFYGVDRCRGKDIYHIDGYRNKNCLSNLAVGTRKDSVSNYHTGKRWKQKHILGMDLSQSNDLWHASDGGSHDN